ncbi:MAG: hypothetical protein ACYCOR_08325 [Acidobacteriaceae bacterium]
MRAGFACLLGCMALATLQLTYAQASQVRLPRTVEAGSAFSIQSTGSGKAVLYIVGPGQALRQDVQLGQSTSFPPGSLYNAGHYLAILVGASSTDNGWFDVVPANKPANLSFLAKPSRLSIGLHNGISGTLYIFDVYHNLITKPTPVSFKLSNPSGSVQLRAVTARGGEATTEMDSSEKEGFAKFEAQVDGVSSTRVVEQVPGNPCGLTMSARPSGKGIHLETNPVRDCSGNAVPDGTIVTFTEIYDRIQSTADVPLKNGVAQVEMPAHPGATITVASGVVLGNEIHWPK